MSTLQGRQMPSFLRPHDVLTGLLKYHHKYITHSKFLNTLMQKGLQAYTPEIVYNIVGMGFLPNPLASEYSGTVLEGEIHAS
jgi:hypothetical protein